MITKFTFDTTLYDGGDDYTVHTVIVKPLHVVVGFLTEYRNGLSTHYVLKPRPNHLIGFQELTMVVGDYRTAILNAFMRQFWEAHRKYESVHAAISNHYNALDDAQFETYGSSDRYTYFSKIKSPYGRHYVRRSLSELMALIKNGVKIDDVIIQYDHVNHGGSIGGGSVFMDSVEIARLK